MYWAFTTMTTIGFGDVTPVSEPEVLVVILAELMGMIIFTFLLSNLATIFAFFSRQQTEATERARQGWGPLQRSGQHTRGGGDSETKPTLTVWRKQPN